MIVITDEMVGRFLSWKLPEGFRPDCYVEFDHECAANNGSWPIGTNLLTADQARDMLDHVLNGGHQNTWMLVKGRVDIIG